MNSALIERHDEIDMILVALLANEHPLLVGPPGTGKSLLIDSLMDWVGSKKKFGVLLSKFSVPDEVFGPLNIKDLKDGRFTRVTAGMLPECEFAFIDEVFKASSAILNSMLKILNERRFKQGENELDCPLKIALAASNEWPEAKELGALFDRFVLRKTVKTVSKAGRRRLLFNRNHKVTFEHTISQKEVDQAHTEALALEFSDAACDAIEEILDALNSEGICPGDRRMKKSMNIARAYAYLRGADEVEPVHLEVLKWVLWDDPTEQEAKCHKIVSRLANPTGSAITELLLQAANVAEGTKPEEAVSKLQDIQKRLKALPEHEKLGPALDYVTKQIGRTYNKVIGLED